MEARRLDMPTVVQAPLRPRGWLVRQAPLAIVECNYRRNRTVDLSLITCNDSIWPASIALLDPAVMLDRTTVPHQYILRSNATSPIQEQFTFKN